jgi:hypothetical protein
VALLVFSVTLVVGVSAAVLPRAQRILHAPSASSTRCSWPRRRAGFKVEAGDLDEEAVVRIKVRTANLRCRARGGADEDAAHRRLEDKLGHILVEIEQRAEIVSVPAGPAVSAALDGPRDCPRRQGDRERARGVVVELGHAERPGPGSPGPLGLRRLRRSGWARSGAGGRPWRRRTVRMVSLGAAHAELEQFALDPAVAPAGVLAGQAEDQLPALGDQTGASAPGPAGAHRPLAPDEIAMPAQERLRADQEREPRLATQTLAESGE